jgi:hypothetical protein
LADSARWQTANLPDTSLQGDPSRLDQYVRINFSGLLDPILDLIRLSSERNREFLIASIEGLVAQHLQDLGGLGLACTAIVDHLFF